MKKKTFLLGASLGCLALFAIALNADAQSITPQMAPDLPQPHLKKARAAAELQDTWNHPGLIMCYPQFNQEAQQVIKIPAPSKAFDNLYNVGIGAVTAWAITTNNGIILIDTLDNTQEAQQYIVGGLKTLGLDPMSIKDIIITHGHGDHYGGARYLQDTIPGVHVYMSQIDYDGADKAAAGSRARGVQAPKHDMVVTDGEKLTLGDETVTMYITPGHTPGTVSMIFPVKDHGVQHMAGFFGGTASADQLTMDLHKSYDNSITRFKKLTEAAGVDVFLSNHPSLDDSDGKLQLLHADPNAPNPFIVGGKKVQIYYTIMKECNLNNWDLAKYKASHKAS